MYIGSSPNFGALDSQTITSANGSTATFTLNQYVPDSDSIIVTVGNVVQEPTEAYTASGNSITFTENVPNGDTIVIRYLGRSVDVYTGYKRVQRFKYVATNGQQTFTGADANSRTLEYTAQDIDVFYNGVRLDESEFTATNGSSVILGTGATTNAELVILAYKVVQLADVVPASSGGTFTGNVVFSGNATVNGNLTASGTTTLVDTTNTVVKDNLLGLNHGATSNSNDAGIIVERGSTGNDALLIWDESEDKWALGTTTSNASSTGNLNMTTGTLVANLEGTIQTASQTNITEVGTLTNFTSTGIDDNADATAITIDSSERVGIGTTSPSDTLHVKLSSGQRVARFESNDNTSAHIAFKAPNTSFMPTIGVKDEALYFSIGDAVEKARIDSSGNFIVNSDDSTDTTTYDNTTGSHGPILHAETRLDIARSATMMSLNSTTTSSSSYVDFRRAGGSIGSISHNSASTVSYNAFTGSHWGRLSDNSKPTILKGTVLETIDEMCDWYEVEFTIPEVKYVDGDAIPKDKKVGDVKTKARDKKYLVRLEDIVDKKVGEDFTFTYKDGVEYTGTLKLEDEEKHSKCKVSDTADSKRVYGVFFSWDGEDDGYNDMYVAGLGTYVVRVHKDVTVESGDLLVSNGDGTAKVQDDDIIRSKTVAKVLTNIKQETYSDGSYTVPCALYCG